MGTLIHCWKAIVTLIALPALYVAVVITAWIVSKSAIPDNQRYNNGGHR